MIVENKDCWMKDRCNHRDCNCVCMRLLKQCKLYDESLISLTQRKHVVLYIDKDGTDRKQFEQLSGIQKDIENFIKKGNNIYIHSQIAGNGKTSWALRMVEKYFDAIWFKSDLTCKALFISVPKFLLALKDNISEKNEYIAHIKENIEKADIVIWDDIGSKIGSEFEVSNLLSMIESRLNLGKSNIFTSNLSNEEMHIALGDRLASRICNLSIDIELHGADKRGLQK